MSTCIPLAITFCITLLGNRDARVVSLPLVTLTLGLFDSINACAFFVLLFLLTPKFHAHSQGRMLAVGVFLSVSPACSISSLRQPG